MGEIKQRDYMFDTFRGLLILSIPMSHFTKIGGPVKGSRLTKWLQGPAKAEVK